MHTEICTRVLLVEDNSSDAFFVVELLSQIPDEHFDVCHVECISEAQATFEHGTMPDVVLLDLSLPDSNGMDSIKAIHNAAPHTPIVVLCGNEDPSALRTAVQVGAQDFLLKGENDARFLCKTIHYAIERQRTERELLKLAHYDSLTGLANRALFNDDLRRALARTKRQNEVLGLLFIDLDHFKAINDTLGHEVGDELLCKVAERIKHVIREGDVAARLGGDEFTVIIEGIEAISSAEVVARKILQAIATPFTLSGQEVRITPSIGIATFPAAGNDATTLMRNADRAMYRVKEQGRNNYQVYSDALNASGLARLNLEQNLRRAIDREEFLLHYQPIFDVATGEVRAVEALLRWNSPDHDKLVAPLEFISILEQTGLIVAVGEWVLRTACTQCKAWHDAGARGLRVAVNVSPRQLHGPNPVHWIKRALKSSGLNAKYLDVEITEGTMLEHPEISAVVLQKIRAMGVGISIDDFGTGYSSLSYLMNFKVNSIKIDRSFINEVTTSGASSVIVTAIIQMAHGLGLRVIAEGVETESQLEFLRTQGCDEFQGFLISNPIEPEALLDLITAM